jgi:hypothetical protein
MDWIDHTQDVEQKILPGALKDSFGSWKLKVA